MGYALSGKTALVTGANPPLQTEPVDVDIAKTAAHRSFGA
jgi:hypothetical protein